MPLRSMTDSIFVLGHLFEKQREKNMSAYSLYRPIKSCDKALREEIWKVMGSILVKVGLHQGFALCLDLFVLIMGI